MKKFVLAAFAALSLSLSLGSAYAAQIGSQHNTLSVAPDYANDSGSVQ